MQLKPLSLRMLLCGALASTGIAGCYDNDVPSLDPDAGHDGGPSPMGGKGGQGDSGEGGKGGGKGGKGGKGGSSGKGGNSGSDDMHDASMEDGGGSGGMGSGGMGSGGMGSGGMGSGGMGSGGATGDLDDYESQACKDCEAAVASCTTARTACLEAQGTADTGPLAGQNKSDICLDLLTCVRRTGCATVKDGTTNVTDCYCGVGVEPNACLTGGVAATGPCKAEVEGAAESAVPGEIALRLEAPTYAAGAAFSLLQFCDALICPFECKLCTPASGSGPSGDAMCHPTTTGTGGADTGGTGSGGMGSGGMGSGGMGSGGMGSGGMGSGGTGGGTSVACSTCESMPHGNPANHNCDNTSALCDNIAGTTTATAANGGTPAIPGGVPFSTVCHQILDCFHRTGCAGDGSAYTDCFCGPGAETNACFAGTFAAATGACKTEVMIGSNSQSVSQIAMALDNAELPIGIANQMVSTCDQFFCMEDCL